MTHSAMDNIRQFLAIRATLTGEETVFWWTGNIYSVIPGERGQRLFQFEGFNIARAVPTEGGYHLLTREAAFYKDPQTGAILENWHNPMNDQAVDVVHVWNDPVNQQFLENGPRGPFAVPSDDLHNGYTCFYFDVLLAYPSPLSRAEYPEHSQSDLYQGAELFQFFVNNADLATGGDDIPAAISWTRLGPWLPWMRMGDQPGNVLYQCRGSKIGPFTALPQHIQDYVMAQQPQFSQAPQTFTTPNETSWTYFKKHKV